MNKLLRNSRTESISPRMNSIQCPVRSTCWCSTTTRAAWWILKLTDGNNKSKQRRNTQKKNNKNNKTGNQREEEEVGGGGIQHSFLRVGNKQWKDGCRHFMRARKAPKKEHRIEVVNANNKKSFPFLPFFSIFFSLNHVVPIYDGRRFPNYHQPRVLGRPQRFGAPKTRPGPRLMPLPCSLVETV